MEEPVAEARARIVSDSHFKFVECRERGIWSVVTICLVSVPRGCNTTIGCSVGLMVRTSGSKRLFLLAFVGLFVGERTG